MESIESRKVIPKISVIIPSYNQGIFLEETLLSILKQEYPNFEIIIIDGGSTDTTIQVIKKYSSDITYWVSEKDKGQSHAVNKGIRIASGDFICWQNSDDVFWPGAFEHFCNAYREHPGYDVYFGHQAIIDQDSKTKFINYFVPFHVLHLRYYGWNITNQTSFFRAAILKSNLLDESLHYTMDYDLYLRLGTQHVKFFLINHILGALREYSTTKSNTFSSDLIIKEKSKICRRLFNSDLENRSVIKTAFIVRYYYFLLLYGNLFKHLSRIISNKLMKVVGSRNYFFFGSTN